MQRTRDSALDINFISPLKTAKIKKQKITRECSSTFGSDDVEMEKDNDNVVE